MVIELYMAKKKILIIGTGVLGAYLSSFFLADGNKIFVTSRYQKKTYKNYKNIRIEKKVIFIKLNILNKNEILRRLREIEPDIIYYFAGQSSIFISYKKELETINSNFIGALNFLEILYKKKSKTKFYKASSGYIFEKFNPKEDSKTKYIKANNPYVKSQIAAFKAVKKFRKKGLNCSSLIFFNIESPMKPNSFLLNKVRDFVKYRRTKFLKLGNIDIVRDFSWAPEIMRGVFYASKLISQDIIFCSGKDFLVKDMIKYFFDLKKMKFEKYIKIDKKLYRKNEKKKLFKPKSNTEKILKKFKWSPKIFGKQLIKKLYFSK